MYTRWLDGDDLSVAIELFDSSDRLMGLRKTEDMRSRQIDLMSLLMSGDPQAGGIVGAFNDDGRLVTTVGYMSWSKLPYASGCCMMSDRRLTGVTGPIDYQKSRLGDCLDMMFDMTEAHGIFKIYSLRTVRRLRLELKRFTLLGPRNLDRYHLATEAFIPAGTIPVHDSFYGMMGRRVWTEDLVIRSASLKEEFRDFSHQISSDRT